jgi:hypothetical protein
MRASQYGIMGVYYWWTGQRWIGPWEVAVGGYECGMPQAITFWRLLKSDIEYREAIGDTDD